MVISRTVTGHAGLAGDTGRDEDDLSALEGLGEARGRGVIAANLALGVDVANVGSDTWRGLLACNWGCGDDGGRTGRKTDVVEGKLADPGVELEEEGERLANATGGTEDGDLGGLQDGLLASAAELRPALMAGSRADAVPSWCCFAAYLAGRGGKAAALDLSEYLPGGEHVGCGRSSGDGRWVESGGVGGTTCG